MVVWISCRIFGGNFALEMQQNNRPLAIIFQNTVAAHKGSRVDNTVRGHFFFLFTELELSLHCQHLDQV